MDRTGPASLAFRKVFQRRQADELSFDGYQVRMGART
jgi:hypothetical protein